jgi:hypothetical protein
MSTLFVIVRFVTGLTSISAFLLIGLVVFLRDVASEAKQGARVLGYVAKLFATAFTEGTAPREAGFQIGVWPIMIGTLALLMTISVFTPGTRWFLHGVAVLAVIVIGGYARMIGSGIEGEIVCLPFLLVWFGYYMMCFFTAAPARA